MKKQKKEGMIIQFMEISGLVYQQAKQQLEAMNYNIKGAIQHFLAREEKKESEEKEVTKKKKKKKNQFSQELLINELSSQPETEITKFNSDQKSSQLSKRDLQKLEKDRERINYKKKYINKSQKSNKKSKQQDEPQTFIDILEKFINRLVGVNFYQDLNKLFEEHWNTRKLIAVHVVNLTPSKDPNSIQNSIFKIFLGDAYTWPKLTEILNKEFLNFIVDPKMPEYQLYPQLRDLISTNNDYNHLIILRIDEKTKEVVKAAKLSMYECLQTKNPEIFKQKVWAMKHDINRAVDQQICPSIHHNPLGYLQKIQLDMDRQIRKQQQEQYMEMKKKTEEEQRKNRQKKLEKGEQSDEQIEQMKQQVMKNIEKQLIEKRRMKKLALKTYKKNEIKEPIQLKIRMPDGSEIALYLPLDQKLQYVFNYISCLEEQLGFVNDIEKKCCLIQPWSQMKLFPSEQMNSLQSIFGNSDSETVIVEEIE